MSKNKNIDINTATADELKALLKQVAEERVAHIATLPDYLSNLNTDGKFTLLRQYTEDEGGEHVFYEMGLLDEVIGDVPFSKGYAQVDPNHFSLNDEGFWCDETGDFISGTKDDYLSEWFYPGDISEWLTRHGYSRNKECVDVIADWWDELADIDEFLSDATDRLIELDQNR